MIISGKFMNLHQLNHTANVLAAMLTFDQPADVVLSNYLREQKNLDATIAMKSQKPHLQRCVITKKIVAVLRRPYVQSRKTALAALVLGRSFNISQLEDLLNEDDNEKEFLSNLKARKSEFSGSLNTPVNYQTG